MHMEEVSGFVQVSMSQKSMELALESVWDWDLLADMVLVVALAGGLPQIRASIYLVKNCSSGKKAY